MTPHGPPRNTKVAGSHAASLDPRSPSGSDATPTSDAAAAATTVEVAAAAAAVDVFESTQRRRDALVVGPSLVEGDGVGPLERWLSEEVRGTKRHVQALIEKLSAATASMRAATWRKKMTGLLMEEAGRNLRDEIARCAKETSVAVNISLDAASISEEGWKWPTENRNLCSACFSSCLASKLAALNGRPYSAIYRSVILRRFWHVIRPSSLMDDDQDDDDDENQDNHIPRTWCNAEAGYAELVRLLSSPKPSAEVRARLGPLADLRLWSTAIPILPLIGVRLRSVTLIPTIYNASDLASILRVLPKSLRQLTLGFGQFSTRADGGLREKLLSDEGIAAVMAWLVAGLNSWRESRPRRLTPLKLVHINGFPHLENRSEFVRNIAHTLIRTAAELANEIICTGVLPTADCAEGLNRYAPVFAERADAVAIDLKTKEDAYQDPRDTSDCDIGQVLPASSKIMPAVISMHERNPPSFATAMSRWLERPSSDVHGSQSLILSLDTHTVRSDWPCTNIGSDYIPSDSGISGSSGLAEQSSARSTSPNRGNDSDGRSIARSATWDDDDSLNPWATEMERTSSVTLLRSTTISTTIPMPPVAAERTGIGLDPTATGTLTPPRTVDERTLAAPQTVDERTSAATRTVDERIVSAPRTVDERTLLNPQQLQSSDSRSSKVPTDDKGHQERREEFARLFLALHSCEWLRHLTWSVQGDEGFYGCCPPLSLVSLTISLGNRQNVELLVRSGSLERIETLELPSIAPSWASLLALPLITGKRLQRLVLHSALEFPERPLDPDRFPYECRSGNGVCGCMMLVEQLLVGHEPNELHFLPTTLYSRHLCCNCGKCRSKIQPSEMFGRFLTSLERCRSVPKLGRRTVMYLEHYFTRLRYILNSVPNSSSVSRPDPSLASILMQRLSALEPRRFRVQINRIQWCRVALVIAFVRANSDHPFIYSILPIAKRLIPVAQKRVTNHHPPRFKPSPHQTNNETPNQQIPSYFDI
jgi:hypothetical protein